jgi:hypothetical protein
MDATKYHSIVGALMYLIHTRLDLTHSVSYVSRFMAEPREDHQVVVKHILRYIAGTYDHGIHYDKGEAGELLLRDTTTVIMLEMSMIDNSRSTSEILFYLGGNPISWQSLKQKSVALSSCEAEYVSSSAACQAIWLAGLLSEILGVPEKPPLLKVDNKSAIDLIKNHVHHGRSKHIWIRYHFIRECAAEGRIEVQFVGTNEQLADILTKPLSRVKFQEMKEKIGVERIAQGLSGEMSV